MEDLSGLGKLLLITGGLLIGLGLLLILSEKIPLLGRLPGDILIRKDGFTFYFPIVTMLLLSLLATLLLNLLLRR
jgi:hypothetical protein